MLPLLLPLLVTVVAVAVAAAVAVADTVAVAVAVVVMFLPGYCTLACALIQSIKRQAQLSAYHKPSGGSLPSPLAQVPLSSLRALPLTWLFWGLYVNVLNNATRLAYRSFACMHH